MFENCEYDCKLCDVPLSNVYDRNLPSMIDDLAL
jgi:hypothetical protein